MLLVQVAERGPVHVGIPTAATGPPVAALFSCGLWQRRYKCSARDSYTPRRFQLSCVLDYQAHVFDFCFDR
jgi:hypothetical protein